MKKGNLASLLWFELLHKVISAGLFLPVMILAMGLCMKSSGYGYLTRENIMSFIGHPATLLALAMLAVMFAVCILIDAGGVLFFAAKSRQGEKVYALQAFRFALYNVRRLLGRENILLIPVLFLVIVVWNFNFTTRFVGCLYLPDRLGALAGGGRYPVVYGAVLAAELLILRLLYAFPYYTITGCSAKEAVKRSFGCGRKKPFLEPLALIAGQGLMYLLNIAFVKLGTALAEHSEAFFEALLPPYISYASIVWGVLFLFLFIGWALVVPFGMAGAMALFYRRQRETAPVISFPEEKKPPRTPGRIILKTERLLLVLGMLSCGIFAYGFTNGHIDVPVEEIKLTQVSAHRGASAQYPENTMAAFEAAAELGADWIELDVRESSDGQLFIMHDASLLRTTGVRRYAWELTWEEISRLDAGSYMGSTFAGEPIPLLSDAIEFARENGVRLNIELKPRQKNPAFVRKVVELVEEAGFEHECVIACSAYWALQEVKSQNPELETVYVMSLAYGNIAQLTDADAFSVRDVNVTERLVSTVHNAGKEIYAWTVNSKSRILRMINLHVDNIITDNITLAKDCIFIQRTEDMVEQYAE